MQTNGHEEFAREVRSGQKLISRWADAPDDRKDDTPHPKPAKPEPKAQVSESNGHPPRNGHKQSTKLESKWASRDDRSATPSERTHPKRRNSRHGNEKPKNTINGQGKNTEPPSSPRKQQLPRAQQKRSQNQKPQVNRLAAHLDPPQQSKHANDTSKPESSSSASAWSLDSYEPGANWADAEEDTFLF